MKGKEFIRNQVWKTMAECELSSSPYHSIPPFKGQKQAAKRLRSMKIYRKAKRIFVPPDSAQIEVRQNILQDRKTLVMATPRLRDGFYEVDPNMPEYLWSRSIKSSGIRKSGRKLKTSQEDIGKIDLMVTGAVAVSSDGERIGKGSGYFDWEYVILREINSIDDDIPVVALVHDLQVFEQIPWQEKDVSVDFIVTPTQIIEVTSPRSKPSGIDWDEVDRHTVASMRPLRELVRRRRSIN